VLRYYRAGLAAILAAGAAEWPLLPDCVEEVGFEVIVAAQIVGA
jgi:hypothetical protein